MLVIISEYSLLLGDFD